MGRRRNTCSSRWGTNAHGTHSIKREGEAGCDVVCWRKAGETVRSQTVSTQLAHIAKRSECDPDKAPLSISLKINLPLLFCFYVGK